MDVIPLFTYHPLTEADSIRLLLLQPAPSVIAPIICNLVHTSISQCSNEIIDHYTALSYVWGDATQKSVITVDGSSVTITASLEAALRDLRDEKRILRLWADALCIDQSNTDERNSQVRQMGAIYSTAHHTVIYLASLSASVKTVFNAIQSRISGIESSDKLMPGNSITQLAERAIISLPWFSRVWIFQELVLSRDPWLQCGNLRVRWTNFCAVVLGPSAQRTVKGKGTALDLLRQMNNTREGRSGGTLLNLLISRRGLGATDPRDMVFAHMGLAGDKQQWDGDLIRIDYRKTCKDVYEGVARYLIQTDGPQKFFVHLDARDLTVDRQNDRDLATWAPDWSRRASYSTPMYRNDMLDRQNLNANRYFVFIPEEHILGMMGYEADSVAEVSITLPVFTQMDSLNRIEYQQAVNDLKSLYHKVGGVYWSGDELGRHVHIYLEKVQDEHERLCDRVCEEWIHIMEQELPSLLSPLETDELNSHHKFISGFKSWLQVEARRSIIFVGADCEGVLSLLDGHLSPTMDESVLDGRRLAITQQGRLAVVPSQARGGDIIAYLGGNAVPVVLRRGGFPVAERPKIEEKIKVAFQSKDKDHSPKGDSYVTSFKKLFKRKTVTFDHCMLLGECHDHGIVGWAVKEEHSHTIFAIN